MTGSDISGRVPEIVSAAGVAGGDGMTGSDISGRVPEIVSAAGVAGGDGMTGSDISGRVPEIVSDISGRVPEIVSDISGRAANYAKAYGGVLQPGSSPALLLVDLVEAYLDPDSPLYAGPGAAEARDVAASLAEVARANDVPVVWTTVSYEEGGANGGLFYAKVPSLELFVGDGPMGKFPAAVSPREDEVVVAKQYPSAFFGTGLETTLREMGIDTLVIGGYSTSGCVRASTLDALCHGFVPIVCRDACADRHPDPHEANLFDLQAKYAEVVDQAAATRILSA